MPSLTLTTVWPRWRRVLALALVLQVCSGDVLAAGKPVTPEEVEGFVDAISEAIQKGEVGAYRRLFDLQVFFDRVIQGVDSTPRHQEQFRVGAARGIEQNGLILASLIDVVAKGGRFEFLRSRSRDKNATALFRFRTEDERIGYFEIHLDRSRDGRVRAIDYDSYFSGELGSETFRRMYVSLVAYEDRGVISRFLGKDREFVDNLSRVKQMTDLVRAGRFAEAEAVRLALPESVRKRKENLLMAVMIGQDLDEATYLRAIDELQASLPNDRCIHLHLIDKYTLTKEYDKALAEVDRLDRSVGGDPFLDFQRTYLNLEARRFDRARALATKLAKAMPDDYSCRMAIVDVDLKREDYPAVLRTLKTVDEEFEMGLGELPEDETYGGFVKSPQYQEWLAHVKARDARNATAPAPPSNS
ncbi:MAG: tetratricopeptide repeat protein [Isosphaeraceae bacterium]